MHSTEEKLQAFQRLLEIMDELREKCPWDREQTLDSLRNLTIEETYELADAIMEDDLDEIRKELGDLLLHIVFYAKIGSEKASFDIKDVLDGVNNKLVFRHPHVFGEREVRDSGEVIRNWEELKKEEGNGTRSALAGVPVSLPALIKSHRIQDKARAVGFDWDERDQVWDKVTEEINEVREEMLNGRNPARMEAEFGDLLFSIVNAARLYDIEPETALERTNRKFYTDSNTWNPEHWNKADPSRRCSEEMETIWQEAKGLE
ncbi:MAG: nucleoside triphosphate pyrophosphohydrolase [Bacteroidales bacterium]